MTAQLDPIAEFERVRIQSQRIRADAIRSRIQTAQLFCSLAEKEAGSTPDQARHTLSKVRRAIEEIGRHIAEPNHISPASADELVKLLSALKNRADMIDHSL